MDVRKFVLSYYGSSVSDFYISEITHPKGALELHSHDYFQIYYLRRGKIVHHLETSVAELGPGDVFIIPPELPHYIETSSSELSFYSISFTRGFAADVRETSALIKDFLHYLTELSQSHVPPSFSLGAKDTVFIDALVGRIMQEFSESETGKTPVIKAAMGLLLSLFARAYLDERCEDIKIRSDRDAVMHSVAYMQNHLSEKITLDEMARKTAMSKAAFCTAFGRIVGESFTRHLNRIRVENAAALISAGESAAVAAELSGYTDFSTFWRNFKRRFGVSPSEYRQRSDDAR